MFSQDDLPKMIIASVPLLKREQKKTDKKKQWGKRCYEYVFGLMESLPCMMKQKT